LSGTLAEGTSTITVTYLSFTDTFNVTVTAIAPERIDAVFTQGAIYPSTNLDSLKNYLTVTVTNNDGSTEDLSDTDYTLSGTLAEGTSTITVTYLSFTDTFNVTVTAIEPERIDAVFTQGALNVYPSTSLDALKANLTVTLINNDGSIAEILSDTDYTLSGTLAEGTSTITVTYNTFTDTFVVNVQPEPTYGIILSQTGPYAFTDKPFGYGSETITPLTVTITNDGNQETGALSVALGGTNADGFTLSSNNIESIAVSGTGIFTVKPNTGLMPGTYTATVAVSGNNGITAGFDVNFTVNTALISIHEIPGVTAPIAESMPDTDTTETAQYSGIITWTPNHSTFIQNIVYTATITLTAKTGYTFNGLSADFFTVSNADTVTNPLGTGETITVTAVFPAAPAAPSDSGSYGDDSHSPNTQNTPANLIPVKNLMTSGLQGTMTVGNDIAKITIPSNMLTGIDGINGNNAKIIINEANKDNLPDDVKSVIGNRPIVELTLEIDGRQTDWSNPDAPAILTIPYTPMPGEDPDNIIVYYIDGKGNLSCVTNGRFDPETGLVTVNISHFSLFAVGYNKVSFNDVADSSWYADAVNFIAARGVTSGTGNGNFSPHAKLTRGEFLVLLMRAYEINPKTDSADNFSDAGNTYYTNYLAAAKHLGISSGIGNNMYAPDKEITRQEMFTLLYNTLKIIGQLPVADPGKSLSDFNDASQVDSWAKDAIEMLVQIGIVGGSNGLLSPLSTATRAEMAQILYNLLSKY
ncbi:MAG: hypothetical protein GX285_05725, partial [Clostridiales bacterium]|nr:hypothetical protein [Clostridiales bacterium]